MLRPYEFPLLSALSSDWSREVKKVMQPEAIAALARRVPQFRSAEQIEIAFLAGGITNLNYRLQVNGESFVLRIAGENSELLGVDRNRELYNHRVAASEGVAPEVIGVIRPEGFLVTRFIEASKLPPEKLRSMDGIRNVCCSLHAVHDGAPFMGTFSPSRAINRYLQIARKDHISFSKEIRLAERLAAEIERALNASHPIVSRPIHSDLLNENLLDEGGVIRILDWEYSGMGDIFFDLGNLADHHEFADEDEVRLLAEYSGEYRPGDVARLKLMRIMSAAREAMWGIVQESVSMIDFDFGAYASQFFERMVRLAGERRYPEWLKLASEIE